MRFEFRANAVKSNHEGRILTLHFQARVKNAITIQDTARFQCGSVKSARRNNFQLVIHGGSSMIIKGKGNRNSFFVTFL